MFDHQPGTAITTQKGHGSAYSPEGKYLFFTNEDSGWQLYRKNTGDLLNGTPMMTDTADQGWNPQYSPDRKYIIYNNLLKKDSNDTLSGRPILDDQNGGIGVYSPDGESIVYTRNNTLFKKLASDGSTGEQIIVSDGSYPRYTADGKYIIYINNTDNNRLYKKDINSTNIDNGIAITTNSLNNTYSIFP